MLAETFTHVRTIPTTVAGVTHGTCQQALAAHCDDAMDFKLVREPSNRADHNAIRVDLHGKKVGYVPAPIAAELSSELDAGDICCWVESGKVRSFVGDEGHEVWKAEIDIVVEAVQGRRSRPRPNTNPATIIMAGTLVFAVMAFMSRDRNPRPTVQPTQNQAGLGRVPRAGERVRLSLPSGKPDGILLLGVTAADQSEFARLSSRNDRAGVSKMLLDSRLIAATQGSVVTILEAGVISHRVKIDEGSSAGKTGWIPVEFVRGL